MLTPSHRVWEFLGYTLHSPRHFETPSQRCARSCLVPRSAVLPARYINAHLVRKKAATARERGYWLNAIHRKQFFLNFAATMNFDPYEPGNWEKVTATQLLENKVAIFHRNSRFAKRAHRGGDYLLISKVLYSWHLRTHFRTPKEVISNRRQCPKIR